GQGQAHLGQGGGRPDGGGSVPGERRQPGGLSQDGAVQNQAAEGGRILPGAAAAAGPNGLPGQGGPHISPFMPEGGLFAGIGAGTTGDDGQAMVQGQGGDDAGGGRKIP